MDAPQYTTCVDPADYEGLSFTPEIIAAIVSLVVGGFNPVALIFDLFIVFEALHKLCEYLLHGKLVCLGGDQCAIGHLAGFETVDDKSGFDKIDNDFSLNVVLSPWDLADFTFNDLATNYKNAASDNMQGGLITQRPGMPKPREAPDDIRYDPSHKQYRNRNYITYGVTPTPGTPFDVPVFHCEIEGERLHLVCAALNFPLSLIPGSDGFCRTKILGIPIGRFICALLSLIFAPIVLAALAIAWVAGSNDNRDFDNAGMLEAGDVIIVHGRWVYDAGHTGWNELHPVLSVQKITNSGDIAAAGSVTDFPGLQQRWCGRTGEAPPPGAKPTDAGITPQQQPVLTAQLQPQNRWNLHPIVDGCTPAEPPPVIR